MKNQKKYWFVALFIIFCNIPIVSSNIKFFFEGNLYDFKYYYITKDKKLTTISLNTNDGSRFSYYYSAYRKAYPNADSTLYRIKPRYFYRFWRWAEYIYDPLWQQPYIDISYIEWNKISKQIYANDRKYGTPFPIDTVNFSKK